MARVVIIISFLVFFSFMFMTFQIRKDLKDLEDKCLRINEEIKKNKSDIKYLESFSISQVGLIEDNYGYLDDQLQVVSRYYNLKTSLEINKIGKDGLILSVANSTSWPGIKEIDLHLNIYDLKGLDQLIIAFRLLEKIENINPLRMLSIFQSKDHLEAEIKLYGR